MTRILPTIQKLYNLKISYIGKELRKARNPLILKWYALRDSNSRPTDS